jgi:dienelactone hydrolase
MNARWLAAAALVLVVGACSGRGTRAVTATTGTEPTTAVDPTSQPAPPPSTTTIAASTTAPPTTARTVPTTIATTTTAPPTPQRPYPIATSTVTLVDPSRPTVSRGRTIAPSRTLTTLLWYPTVAGRWPLIVFAHGFQVGPVPYTHLCEAWAAAGYVVAAPEFPLTDAAVAGAALDEADINNQPADVRFVAASLVAGGPTSTRIDPAHIAMAGHSDGAETALAAGVEGGLRIRAVIALAVSPLPSGGSSGNPPLLVGQGDQDTINPPALGQAVFNQAARPRYLLNLIGAGHLPPFTGTAPWQPVVDRVTIDFLDRYVAGRPVSAAALVSDGSQAGVASVEASP